MNLPEPHAEQYKMLRTEIMDLIDQTRKTEVYVVGGLAALYAWLAKEAGDVPFATYFIGVPLVLLGGVRSIAIVSRMKEIATYLRKIESEFFTELPSLPGWERYIHETRNPAIGKTAIGVWVCLLIASVLVPFLLRR